MKGEFNNFYQNYLRYLNSTGRIDLLNLSQDYKKVFFWIEEYLKEDLPEDKNSKILVLACGLGHEVYALNRLGYNNVIGVDLSEEQLNIACNNGLNCICQDVFSYLKNATEVFDVIISFGFIEHLHVSKALNLLKLCYKKMNNNGILILKTPNANNPFSLKWIYGDVTHVIAFNDTSLTQLLILAGFRKFTFKNVKPFSKRDTSFLKSILKNFLTILVSFNYQILRMMYLMNGFIPPKIVSPDLLCIACK